ncbi:hypothetical protein [Marasmitruncus massiliensis]|uniref:hypothetical protein n=1 Tax=Marasmitruncus massiliensis TaxID=1944642 RepID=UPI0015E1260E|nr:hypothetical protein [Marasmitruncus massiliensis]
MSITKIEIQFPKGKAIVIGKKAGDLMIVDGIVLHTAFTQTKKFYIPNVNVQDLS